MCSAIGSKSEASVGDHGAARYVDRGLVGPRHAVPSPVGVRVGVVPVPRGGEFEEGGLDTLGTDSITKNLSTSSALR